MDPLHLSQLYPYRPPDARYQRASAVIQSGARLSCRHDDAPTRRILNFLRLRQRCARDWDHCQLLARQPGLYLAVSLRETARDRTRGAIEARLLAGEPAERIAQKTGTRKDAIEWYAAAFYDVADRLGHRDFIINEVIGTPVGYDEAAFLEHHWKLAGFLGGPGAVDRALDGGMPAAGPRNAADGLEWHSNYTRALVQQKVAVAVQALDPLTEGTSAQLLKVFAQLEVSRRRSQDGVEATPSQIERHVAAMLEAIPWRVGAPGEESPPELRAFDTAAAELRDDQLMRVCSGETLENAEEILNMEMPAPRKNNPPNTPAGGLR